MIRELDHRRNDEIDVRLLWNVRTNDVFVVVVDEQQDTSLQFDVPPAKALDAFHHPYAYAPLRRPEDFLAA